MLKGGVSLRKYLKDAVIRDVKEGRDKVMKSIRWDGYERLLRLAYKMSTSFNTGGIRGYRFITTPITAEDTIAERKDEEGIEPPVSFIEHFLSTHQLEKHQPYHYWRPFFRVLEEDGELLNIDIEQLRINEDLLHGAQSIYVASNIQARNVFEFPYLQTSMKPEGMVNNLTHEQEQVMLIGAYVKNSVAAIVGNLQWPITEPFFTVIRDQTDGEERIQGFGEAASFLVKAYRRRKPNRIIIFRYAVSNETLWDELEDLRQSLRDGDYAPTITMIVVKKNFIHPSLENNLEDDFEFDFYFYRPGVWFHVEIFNGEGSISKSNIIFYCYKDATYTFRMVPPIVYAHLAIVRVLRLRSHLQ